MPAARVDTSRSYGAPAKIAEMTRVICPRTSAFDAIGRTGASELHPGKHPSGGSVLSVMFSTVAASPWYGSVAGECVDHMLEGMNDYLSTLPFTLHWISESLGKISGVPWPLWLGGFFPVYLGALSVTIWVLRGTVWPVRCAYPITKNRRPCRIPVPGEWHRCWHHNSTRYHRSVGGGHVVDVKIRRWQQVDHNRRLIVVPRVGMGFVRTRPVGRTLLYEHGYARTPRNVLSILPEFFRKLWGRIRDMRLRGREAEPIEVGDPSQAVAAEDSLAAGLRTVVSATRFAVATFAAALVVTLVSILFDGSARTVIQWVATLAFVLAWAAINSGIRLREWDWLSRACRKSLLWWLRIFVPVGILNAVFTFASP